MVKIFVKLRFGVTAPQIAAPSLLRSDFTKTGFNY